ncbi:Glutathione-dependent formaldehyde-activating enzyme [Zhongshania aliphaticivorans]|uniref:Glutathione-dependent formaldehyde-activating enzyme n=1 Tax=Zhongshania aliphaticivorans TaxID=1470434 RepID=A0A5S9Q289_9GAMM|nr:GFA family protein [Zhongshania aliphaticivorans]CAA0093185.1 Glutathione-dependent formaldehyde-activating enzyme [Zhongshania aliphaticivorans]CAA0110986.1 Glutathione-dependent formaldehyde-activating enzyme [Zhongshania aliphaticivorans]
MVEGSCLCGKIGYQVEINPDNVLNCHCKFCRKAHGADYATMAIVDASTFKLIDENGCLKEHQSGAGGYRAFCSECGTRLMNYSPDRKSFFCVSLSTVDTALDLKPVAHINVESKAHWCEPYEGIPQFSAFPESL